MAMALFDLRLLRPRAPTFVDTSPCSGLLLRLVRCASVMPVPAHRTRGVSSSAPAREDDDSKAGEMPNQWKKLDAGSLGICSSMISRPAKRVLNVLKRKGYEVYLVGGCVRDLILRRTPKDFDIITSAQLEEVVRAFPCCLIVGKRFPICHVHMDNTIVEVSSFTRYGKNLSRGLYGYARRPGCDVKDNLRWRDSLQRDFTINSLFFDPYANIIYDYVRGMEDIMKARVRTVIPAEASFTQDCARILRAIRVAGRLGFRLSKETAYFVQFLSSSVRRLDKGRLLMELNYMLAYGSAETSLRLLWKYGLLDVLLPFQAAYFVESGFRRRDVGSNFLLTMFSNLDKLLAPNRPCDSMLWVGLLAFHKAISDQPRRPCVVAAFTLALNNGGDMVEALEIARTISRPHNSMFPELLEDEQWGGTKGLKDEIVDLATSVLKALADMADGSHVYNAMARYPKAPYSDLVFIPPVLSLRVREIFQCVSRGPAKGSTAEQVGRIDYKQLARGNVQEIRQTFARVVLDTVYLSR